MKIENRIIEVSHDNRSWYKRVLVCIKMGKAICWQDAETLEKAEREITLCTWAYWREIPEPKYRPFTWEDRELLRNKWIRNIGSGMESLIVEFGKTTDGRLVVHTFTSSPVAEVLMEEFEFLDGTPCGISEK